MVIFDTIYLSNGLLDVLLFSITRPFLLPHDLPSSDIEHANLFAGPPGIENLNDRTDNEAPAVPLELPVRDDYFRPQSDNGGALRWFPDGVTYLTSSQTPSTISAGL
jgi:hypothetical protein